MSPATDNLSQLNAQRRRAVQLRVDGRSLAQIRLETGLSVPTIIKAFKAFTAGGWRAVDVGARGRPQGSGRAMTAAQERELALLALYGPPEKAGLAASLWSADAVQAAAHARFGVELHARAAARCLARWGLSLVALRDAAARHAVVVDGAEHRARVEGHAHRHAGRRGQVATGADQQDVDGAPLDRVGGEPRAVGPGAGQRRVEVPGAHGVTRVGDPGHGHRTGGVRQRYGQQRREIGQLPGRHRSGARIAGHGSRPYRLHTTLPHTPGAARRTAGITGTG